MISNKCSRKGSTIIPAVFLLLFIIMFGATLVKGVLLSTNFSTRILEKRQAYLLAESATNYICDTLAGTQNTGIFTTLDTLLESVAVGTTVSTPVKINSQSIDTQIKLTLRTVSQNKTHDYYTVTSIAKQGSISQKISRQIIAERIQGGLGDISILGTSEKNKRDTGIYSLGATTGNIKNKIIGTVRLENIKNMICTNIIVQGDLYLSGEIANRLEIYLSNVTVEKNLYIITPAKSGNAEITLINMAVGGDILVHTNGSVALVGEIKAKNMYLHVKADYISDNALASTSAIDNIYLYSHITPSALMKNIFPISTIHNNADADKIIDEQRTIHSSELFVDTNISKPVAYDFEFTGDTEFSNDKLDINGKKLEFDFTRQKTYTISMDKTYSSLSGSLKITGDGAVNIFINDNTYATVLLNDFTVEHTPGSTAAVNIIFLKEGGILSYTKDTSLQANLIVPNGQINLSSSTIDGVGVAKEYVCSGVPSSGYFFNSKVSWADFGGGLPSLGTKSVTYSYGKYVK